MSEPKDAAAALVSVVMPVYNGERFLAEAIDSVVRQNYRPLEIVLIDDGSTDGTKTIATGYPEVRYTHQPNQGLAAALNLGVKEARGAFLAFLDADDLWVDGKLELQIAMMNEHPGVDIVFGHFRRLYSPEIGNPAGSAGSAEEEPLPGYFKGTALIRTESFWRVGPFDTGLKLGDFIDWFSRAKAAGLVDMMLPEVTLIRRVHKDNKSYRQKDDRSDYLRIVKAALDRDRQRQSRDAANSDPKDGPQDQA